MSSLDLRQGEAEIVIDAPGSMDVAASAPQNIFKVFSTEKDRAHPANAQCLLVSLLLSQHFHPTNLQSLAKP